MQIPIELIRCSINLFFLCDAVVVAVVAIVAVVSVVAVAVGVADA